MAQDPIYEQIVSLLEAFVDTEQVNPGTRLKADLALDSMELVQLVMELNQCFEIQIVSTEITPEHFDNLQSLSDWIRHKVEVSHGTGH